MKFTKREMPRGDGNGGSYLKVTEGSPVKGVFRGEVHEFYQAWPQGGQKQIFSVPTAGASARFKINFVTHENGKFTAKVWEFGLTVYNQLAELSEDYDLETTKLKISRRGEGKNTIWSVIPLAKEKLTPAMLAEIEAVDLNILGAAPAASEPADDASEVPF